MTLATINEPPQKVVFFNGVNLYEYCHCCSLLKAQFATVAQSQPKKKEKGTHKCVSCDELTHHMKPPST